MRPQKKIGLAILALVLATIAIISERQQPPLSHVKLNGQDQLAIYQSYLHKFRGKKVVVEDFTPEELDDDTLSALLSQEGDERWDESFPLGDRKYAIPLLEASAEFSKESKDFYPMIDEAKQRAMDFDELQNEFGAGARFVTLSPIAQSQTRAGRYYFYCTEISGPLSASSGIIVVEYSDGEFEFVDVLILWVS